MTVPGASLLCGLLLSTSSAQALNGLLAETSVEPRAERMAAEEPHPAELQAAELQAAEPATDNGVWGHASWTDLQGRRWSASNLLGKVVVVDFWATWCPPCLAEIPQLKKLRQRHGDRLVLLGVALDSLDRRRLTAFLHRQGMAWPQIHAPQGFRSEPADHFGIDTLPAIRIVDRRGRLVASDLRGRALEVTVRGLMSEGDGSP